MLNLRILPNASTAAVFNIYHYWPGKGREAKGGIPYYILLESEVVTILESMMHDEDLPKQMRDQIEAKKHAQAAEMFDVSDSED